MISSCKVYSLIFGHNCLELFLSFDEIFVVLFVVLQKFDIAW